MYIASWIGDAIAKALLDVIWAVFIQGPLNIISAFNSIFNYLSGEFIQQLLFKKTNKFDWSSVPTAFWGFAIFAAVVICFIFWSQYIAMIFTETKEMKNKFITCLKMTLLGSVIIFFIPVGFFILNQIIIFFTANINNIFGMPPKSNIADYLWHIGDSTWNGNSGGVPGNYSYPDNILDYNIVIEIFATWFILVTMGIVAMILVQKNLELFFLFIISPIVAATMANDHGKRINTWKDMVIAKSIATSATIISYYTFLLALSLVYSITFPESFTWIEKQILLVALICGGALACYNSSTMVASLVNESVGMREGMSTLSSTFAVASGVGAALGFKKRYQNNHHKNHQNNQNSENDDEFKVPFEGLRQRSGALGFLGDTVAHGTNLLYSATKPVRDYVSSEDHQKDSRAIKAGKIAAKATLSPIKNAALSPFKTAWKHNKKNTHGTWKARHDYEVKKAERQKEEVQSQKIKIEPEEST